MIELVSETVYNPRELMKKLNEVVGILNQTLQESAKKDIIIDQYAAENMQLKHELSKLKTLVFGAKSERFQALGSADQMQLSFEAESPKPLTAEQLTEKINYTQKKAALNVTSHPGRTAFPASLPREENILLPDTDLTGYREVGREITEELEYIPGKLFVRQYIRPKYVRKNTDDFIVAPLPSRPIEKGIAGPGLLSQIIIDKYVDHRQVERFKREGITLAASTLSGWLTACCTLLDPLYQQLKNQVLKSSYLQVDESPIKVLDKDKKGSSHKGFYWLYYAPVSKQVFFDYRQGRGREGPEECLKNFTGYLQTDGYQVYENFAKRSGITHMGCMSHSRRKFSEAMDNDGTRAEYVLGELQKVYAIERKFLEKRIDAAQLFADRTEQAAPILVKLKEWMLENYVQVLPKSPIGKAIQYALSRWDQLSVYLLDADLLIDNNQIENAVRPLAIGRKNYLFAGSHEAAQRAAMLYSFMGTCKKNGVNPFEWLRDILIRIPEHHANKLDELLPQNWVNSTKSLDSGT
ncbi:transposase [Pedobacter sp. UYP24]